MMTEKLAMLQQTLERFAGYAMPAELKEQLENMAQECHYAKDTTLLSVEELPQEIYYICKGLCRSYYLDKDGNDVTRFFILEGDFCFTEVQILSQKSDLCIETLEDCDGLAFQIEDLDLLQDWVFMKDAYIEALKSNLRYKLRRESGFLLGSATERYLEFQLRYPGLEQRVRQSQLASYLGITPTSLSRIRRTLRKN